MESHFKNVESFELDVLALVSKHVHHHLQVGFLSDVSGHDVEIGTVKEDFAQELKGLALGDIIVGKQEGCEGGEKLYRMLVKQ